MQLLTLKNLDKFYFLEDERIALIKLIEFLNKKGIKVYLIGSRLKGWGKDIDLYLKNSNLSLSEILDLKYLFWKYSDTKLDIIQATEKTKAFEKILELTH